MLPALAAFSAEGQEDEPQFERAASSSPGIKETAQKQSSAWGSWSLQVTG